MVGDLLSPESAGDIQVTGKVSMANVDAVNATSVIRSPPNSGDEEDSSWFLREMLHRRVAAHSSPARDDEEEDDHEDEHHHHSLRELHSGASGRLHSHKAPSSLLGLALTVRKSSERKNSPSSPQATSTPALSQVKRCREPSVEDEVNSKIEFERNPASSLSPVSAAAMSKADNNLNPTQPSHVRASPQLVVNGCKKRKLYQPQQHESARYSSDDDDQYFLQRPEPSSLGGGPHVSNPQRPLLTGVSHTPLPGSVDPLKTLQDQMEALQSKYAHAYATEQAALALANAVTPRVPVRDRAVRDDAKMAASAASARAHQRLPSTTNPMSCHNLSQLSQAVYLDATRRLILEQEVRLQRDARDREGVQPTSVNELEGLAEILKQEISSSLTVIIDATLARFAQRRAGKESGTVGPTKNEELTANTATSFDAKSPRGRVVDRGSRTEPPQVSSTPPALPTHTQLASFLRSPLNLPAAFFQQPGSAGKLNPAFYHGLSSLSAITTLANLASPNTPPTSHPGAHYSNHTAPPSPPTYPYDDNNEQCEALSLVKRQSSAVNSKHNATTPPMSSSPTPSPSPSPPPAYPPTSAGNLSTSVAISNPYSSFYRTHSPSSACDSKRERQVSSPLSAPHPASLLHPALLAAHGGDLSHLHYRHELVERGSEGSMDSGCGYDALSMLHASTLTPMHLRKAKLMFFWVRYPSSSVLKTFFPDVKFNKNNTAQLVKWFSNFREFYYIQMEKYSRHLLSQGLTSPDDIYITADSELFRVLNLHYNRNNHVQAPPQFLYVVTQTMKEFFRAIQASKDAEPSWKKAIYKVIARLDDSVPEYFKTPNFLEQLEYRND